MCTRGSGRRKCYGRGGIRESTRKQNCRMVRISSEFRIFEDVLYKFRFLTSLRHKIWNEDVEGIGKGKIGGLF